MTWKPRFFSNRQKPAAITLFPTPDPVPWNIKARDIYYDLKDEELDCFKKTWRFYFQKWLAKVSTQPFRNGKSFLFQELWIEEFGLITRSAVTEDGDNRFSGAQFFGQANCTCDVDPGGTPEAKPFLL